MSLRTKLHLSSTCWRKLISPVLQDSFSTYQEFILHHNLSTSHGSVGNAYPPLLLDDHDRDSHSKSPKALKSQTLARKWALWERNLFWCNNPLKVTPAVSAATFTGSVKWVAYKLKSNPLGRTNCTYKLMTLTLNEKDHSPALFV